MSRSSSGARVRGQGRWVAPLLESLEPRLLLSFNAVPTFESLGLYWSPTGGDSSVQATVRYKQTGTSTWKDAQDLWFGPAENGRPAEYRGSIVGLQAGATYDIELDLAGATPPETFQAATWADNFPIAQTIVVNSSSTPLEINNVHGSPTGYILYTAAPGIPGGTTIDVANQYAYNVRIQNSDYVIVRGLTLTGATGDGILLGPGTAANGDNVHDIVIENNDISNWGTVHPNAPTGTNWGYDDQSGVRSNSSNLQRIIIQRNKIHNPRTDSNSWKEYNPINGSYHPYGPQGITFENNAKGNIVVRYNEIYGDNDHRFNDGMGSDQNFGYTGFPRQDSDIYGNYVAYTWDDAIESEGANMNVRIWGNYTDETYTGVAISGTTMGPLYVYRNVFHHSRTGPSHAYGGGAFKRGGSSSYPSNGRMYLYNNTLYYTTNPTFQTGIGERTDANFSTNTIGRNNILRVRGSSGDKSVYNRDVNSSFDYDLYNGVITTVNASDETNGIQGLPTYVTGAGLDLGTMTGVFQLTGGSLGYDSGVVIPNFTDGYDGAAPDIGAHEAGQGAMQFGVNAYLPPAPPSVNAISVNLANGTANALSPTDVVGAVEAANWNNSTTGNQTLSGLVDNSGATTSAQIAFGSTTYGYTNSTGELAAPMDDDDKMMRSTRALSNSSITYATVTQSPYATYDVYVYYGGRTTGESVPSTMTVDLQYYDAGTWATAQTKYIRDNNRTWDGTYNESTATVAADAVDGNEYVVFRGVTNPDFRIRTTSGRRTGLSGLQIVEAAPSQVVAAADAYVRGGSYANQNFGDESGLMIKNDSADYTRLAYLRFALSQYTSSISSAMLRLPILSRGAGASAMSIEVRLVTDDSWTESGITWNNRPTTGTTLATISGASLASGDAVEIDLTSAVNDAIAGDGQLSIALVAVNAAGSDRWVQLGSSENSDPLMRPVLTIA